MPALPERAHFCEETKKGEPALPLDGNKPAVIGSARHPGPYD